MPALTFASRSAMDWQDCRLMAGVAKVKRNLKRRVEWLAEAEVLAAGAGGVEAELRAAVRDHDKTALAVGRFYVQKNQQHSVTNIGEGEIRVQKESTRKLFGLFELC